MSGNREVAEELFNQGLEAHDQQDFDLAKTLYMQAIDADPEYEVAYNNMGMVCIDMEQFEEAAEYLQQTLKIDPSYAEAYNNLGFIYRKLGNADAAADYYERFLQLDPTCEDAGRIQEWIDKTRAAERAKDEGHGRVRRQQRCHHADGGQRPL